jgi:hypothetical protein
VRPALLLALFLLRTADKMATQKEQDIAMMLAAQVGRRCRGPGARTAQRHPATLPCNQIITRT